jgi:hypothetical protein
MWRSAQLDPDRNTDFSRQDKQIATEAALCEQASQENAMSQSTESKEQGAPEDMAPRRSLPNDR